MKLPPARCVPRAADRYQSLLRLMTITERMTAHGWLVCQEALARHERVAQERVDRYRELFLKLTGLPGEALGKHGGGRTEAIKRWFWEEQHAPQLILHKHTKRPQFTTELLIEYATSFRDKPYGPAAAALYGLGKNVKSLEFCGAYRQLSAADGRIHFGFNPAGTQTGRWTSSTRIRVQQPDGSRAAWSANAQQVPNKSPYFDFGDGPEQLVDSLRDVFVADPGHVLLVADYDQLELRLIAYTYGAQRLIEWIESGQDAHMLNAQALFGLPSTARKTKAPANDDERYHNAAREAAKPLAYGVSYQMHSERKDGTYPTLYKALKKVFPQMTQRVSDALAAKFFELHPEIKRGQAAVRDRVRRHGYAELSIDGRRLYYPDTMRGFNQALNFPMQGTGGALVNRALLALAPQLDWEAGQQVRAQVHDELVLQAPVADAADVGARLEAAMSLPARIGSSDVGIPASATYGPSWGEQGGLDSLSR